MPRICYHIKFSCIAIHIAVHLSFYAQDEMDYNLSFGLTNTYNGSNFFSQFRFFTDNDPTSGYVQYVDSHTAKTSGLTQVIDGTQIHLGVDHSTIIKQSGSSTTAGRKSVRLESLQTFDRGILVADFAHVPSGVCGTWPAYWTYNYSEAPYGEVDILEGDSDQVGDIISLHTSADCKLVDNPRSQSGTEVRTDCSLKTNYMNGCGVSAPPNSYGDLFNDLGGGIWVLYLYRNELAVWQFPRNNIPADIGNEDDLSLNNCGAPLLNFKSHGRCRVSEEWKSQTIIFNIDFCGENAGGSNWEQPTPSASQSCAESTGFDSCEAYVAANPEAFSNSYFLINSIKVYQARAVSTLDESPTSGAESAKQIPQSAAASLVVTGWALITGVFLQLV